jgi:uncharacterized protein involved in cysteine biosynthesis
MDGQMEFNRIFTALTLALRQLGDWRFISVILRSVLLMLLITGPFFLLFIGIASTLEWLFPAQINLPLIGQVGFLGMLTKGLVSKTSWVFWTYIMAPIALTIVGFFLDRIADAVEKKHYSGLPAPRRMTFSQSLFYAFRFLGLTASISIVALIASLFFTTLGPVIFIGANGYLIAREYSGTVAARRMPAKTANRLIDKQFSTCWALGALLALLLNIPFLNLVVPVVGVAAFTHLFHRQKPMD